MKICKIKAKNSTRSGFAVRIKCSIITQAEELFLESMFSTKKSKNRSRVLFKTFRFGFEVFSVTAVVLIFVFVLDRIDKRSFLLEGEEVILGESYPITSGMKAIVLGEETQVEKIKDPVLESQNYRIRQLTFGGDATIPLDQIDNVALKISDVRSELLTTRDEQGTKLIVSWKTNKPSASEITYGKNIEQGGTTIKEDSFGYSHSAVLSSLDYSSAYTYLIKGRDKWSNNSASEQFAFYTGAPRISLVDLLFGAFKDVFSWAIKE